MPDSTLALGNAKRRPNQKPVGKIYTSGIPYRPNLFAVKMPV